jgi:hypothetical protein
MSGSKAKVPSLSIVAGPAAPCDHTCSPVSDPAPRIRETTTRGIPVIAVSRDTDVTSTWSGAACRNTR